MIDRYGALVEQSARENWSAQRETYGSATLSNTNLTWTSLELNPGSSQEEAVALPLGHILSQSLHFTCAPFQIMY
jgi:hypothetical protein